MKSKIIKPHSLASLRLPAYHHPQTRNQTSLFHTKRMQQRALNKLLAYFKDHMREGKRDHDEKHLIENKNQRDKKKTHSKQNKTVNIYFKRPPGWR